MLNTIPHGEATEKPTLLIAHGLFGSGRNWGVIAKRLADRGRVVAVDMRNHGTSAWEATQSYFDMAADLAAVIESLGQPVDIVGHSMGGKAAMVLALTRPDLLRRLIVADIAPVAYGHTQLHLINALREVNLNQVERRADAEAQLQGIEDPALRSFLLQSLDIKENKWRLNLEVLAEEMPKILSFPEITGSFEQPTLFLAGADSQYVLPEHRPEIKRLFPTARFAKIPGAGHWLHAEKPREFEAAVRAFLDAKI